MTHVWLAVLVLCTAAIVVVALAIFLRIKRHLRQEHRDSRINSLLSETSKDATREEKTS